MLIAQISDPHVTDDLNDLPVDPRERLDIVIDHINAITVPLDLVVATGDLINNGTSEEYSLLLAHLERIDAPVRVLPGNHDDAGLMRSALSDYLPAECADTHLSYVIDNLPVRLVCLDTSLVGHAEGVFDRDREAWLDQTLAASTKPTIVFMHHPAFNSGMRFMDAMSLTNKDEFAHVIGKHPHVSTVASGHLHRSITTRIAHAVATGAPSTTHQLALDLDPSKAGLSLEPSGYLLHSWNGSTVLTHAVTVGDFEIVPIEHFMDEPTPN